MATRPAIRERTPKRAASRPPLRVVAGSRRRRWSPIPIVVLAVLTVFGVTALHATIGQDGLKAAKLEREVREETERMTLMRARASQLSSASRVASEAEKLGLVGSSEPVPLRVPMDEPPPKPRGGIALRGPATP